LFLRRDGKGLSTAESLPGSGEWSDPGAGRDRGMEEERSDQPDKEHELKRP